MNIGFSNTVFDLKKKEAYDSVNQPNKLPLKKSDFDTRNIFLFKTTVLRALSDETRQGIIILLGKYESLCVSDLAIHFKVSRPTVSHHLQVLKQARIVKSVKVGKEMYYLLNVRYLKRSVNSLGKIIDSIMHNHEHSDEEGLAPKNRKSPRVAPRSS